MKLTQALNSFLAVALSLFILFTLLTLLPGQSPQIIDLSINQSQSLNYHHLVYNASLHWPSWIYEKILPDQSLNFYHSKLLVLPSVAAMFLGYFWLLSLCTNSTLLLRAVLALLVNLLILILLGHDLVVFSLVSSILILTALGYLALTKVSTHKTWQYLYLIAVVFTCLTTGTLALVPILLALILSILLKTVSMPSYPLIRTRADYVVILAPIIITFLFLAYSDWPKFPNFSALGHVIADDGLPGNILPLFAPTTNIPIIDRETIRALFSPVSICLLLLCLLFKLLAKNKALTSTALLLAVLACLDLSFAEAVSQIAPVACLERLIPGLFFFPLSILLLCITLVLLGILYLNISLKAGGRFILALISLASIIYSYYKIDQNLLQAGIAIPKKSAKAFYEYQEKLATDQDFWQAKQAVLLSPSYAVLNETGLWPLTISSVIQNWQYTTLYKENPVIEASSNQSQTKNLIDRNKGTRWSPGGGIQTGKEWLLLKFAEPITIQGLELETGPFHTDFARGIEIWAGDNCNLLNPTNPTNSNLQQVANYPDWQGPLIMTVDDFLYYGRQGLQKVYFSHAVSTYCLLIKQTGKKIGYDWSVSQVRVLRYPQ